MLLGIDELEVAVVYQVPAAHLRRGPRGAQVAADVPEGRARVRRPPRRVLLRHKRREVGRLEDAQHVADQVRVGLGATFFCF